MTASHLRRAPQQPQESEDGRGAAPRPAGRPHWTGARCGLPGSDTPVRRPGPSAPAAGPAPGCARRTAAAAWTRPCWPGPGCPAGCVHGASSGPSRRPWRPLLGARGGQRERCRSGPAAPPRPKPTRRSPRRGRALLRRGCPGLAVRPAPQSAAPERAPYAGLPRDGGRLRDKQCL